MPTCVLCGYQGFKNWKEYHSHHKERHNVTMATGVPTIDFTEVLKDKKVYKPMAPAEKQRIVELVESRIRADAWFKAGMLNPLIGTTNTSSEPVWNENKEVI